MTMQMEIKKAIAAMTVTRKQAEALVARKKMTILQNYVGIIEKNSFVSPTYIIR
jgi:hypothetical protein